MIEKKFRQELILTFQLALPIIIGQLGTILMGTSDNIVVGRLLGATSLGAAGIANSVSFLIASLSVGGLAVIAPMVSKLLAEKNNKKLPSLFYNSFIVSLIYATVLSLIGFIFYKNFGIFGQKEEIETLATPFFLLIVISNIPMMFFFTAKQFTDGFSKPTIVMTVTILGLVFNVFINIALIRGLWFFPELGLNGAAWGTIAARVFMFVLLFLYLRKNSTFASLFETQYWRVDTQLIKEIFSRSIPSGFQVFFEMAAFSIAVIMMGWISETALSSHQIAINIASTTYMMATGFAHAGSIRIGEAWGNRDGKGIILSGKATYTWTLFFMSFCAILILSFGDQLVKIYLDNDEVLKAALPLLTIAAFFQLSDGAQVVGLGVLRGLADIKIPTYITFVAYWVIALPLGYMLGFKYGFEGRGIWIGLLLGLTISAILLYTRFKMVSKKRLLQIENGL